MKHTLTKYMLLNIHSYLFCLHHFENLPKFRVFSCSNNYPLKKPKIKPIQIWSLILMLVAALDNFDSNSG